MSPHEIVWFHRVFVSAKLASRGFMTKFFALKYFRVRSKTILIIN